MTGFGNETLLLIHGTATFYAFLFWVHHFLVEMHQWFMSVPLVHHAQPTHKQNSSMMVLSPTIANWHETRSNLWNQQSHWFKIVDSIFRDQFDSSKMLRSMLPSWIIHPSAMAGWINCSYGSHSITSYAGSWFH